VFDLADGSYSIARGTLKHSVACRCRMPQQWRQTRPRTPDAATTRQCPSLATITEIYIVGDVTRRSVTYATGRQMYCPRKWAKAPEVLLGSFGRSPAITIEPARIRTILGDPGRYGRPPTRERASQIPSQSVPAQREPFRRTATASVRDISRPHRLQAALAVPWGHPPRPRWAYHLRPFHQCGTSAEAHALTPASRRRGPSSAYTGRRRARGGAYCHAGYRATKSTPCALRRERSATRAAAMYWSSRRRIPEAVRC